MLGHQYRRRSEHGDLLSVLDRLEGRPDRNLRLPVAGVSADEPVHDSRRLHVALDVLDGGLLVGRVFVEEGRLHLALPAGVGWERVTAPGPAGGVELQQLGRHLMNRGFGLPPQGLPPLPPDAVEARGLVSRVRADPPLDLVEPVDGDAEHLAPVVGDHENLDRLPAYLHALQPAEAADAMLHVDDVIARRQLGQAFQGRGSPEAPPPP